VPELEDHRIIEQVWLDGSSSSSNPSAIGRATNLQILYWTRLSTAPSNWVSNTSRDGASTVSLASLFQQLTTLSVN